MGSNILLSRIPHAGRIVLVDSGEVISPVEARDQFEQTAFLSQTASSARDWTTAVIDCIDNLELRPGERFNLADIYTFEDRLAEQYPENDHIQAKIRQQLQVLRDEGLIEFLGDGEYRLEFVDDRSLNR